MSLKIALLGEVTAQVDRRLVDLGPARQRCVLAALAVDAGRLVPAERLVRRVWGADTPRRGRATLHSHISRLRGAFGGALAIVHRSDGYTLVINQADQAVDLLRFRVLCDQAHDAGENTRTAALLTEALALWCGEPLTGLSGEWVESERDRWQQERQAAEHDLVDARLRLGHGVELVAQLSARTAQHPLDERVAGQCMLALHRAGRPADALSHYQQVRNRLVEELGTDPGTALQDLHRQILAADPSLLPAPAGTTSGLVVMSRQLPVAPAPFVDRWRRGSGSCAMPMDRAGQISATGMVGRAELLAHIQQLMRRVHLVTLTGPGGVGKTRVAAEAAQYFSDIENIPVAAAELADVTTVDGLHREVASAFGIVDQSSKDPVDVMVEHLRGARWLLVLDNCEHLSGPVGDLVIVLLEKVSALCVLATSRCPLHIRAEHVIQVPPLSVPEEGVRDRAEQSDAMRLLLERSAAAGRVIDDEDDWAALVCLVRWSGGLPLVLELVAVRLGGGMAPSLILERLAGGLLLASRGSRRVQPHHQTLQQVLDWSYALCPPGEARLWARISVFAGGFDLAAAEAVCAGGAIAAAEVIDLLEGLVQQSLVASSVNGRYHQLQPIREYGQRKLAALGERETLRHTHCTFFHRLSAQAAANWFGPGEAESLARVEREIANFRTAVDHCVATPGFTDTGMAITTNLTRSRVCFFHARLGEFCDWFERLLDAAPARPSPARVAASAALGWIRLCQGVPTRARLQLDHCQDLLRRGAPGPEPAPVAFAEGAYMLFALGDPASVDQLAYAAASFAAAGDEFAGDQAMARLIGAIAAGFLGDEPTASRLNDECLAATLNAGADWSTSWALWATGVVQLYHGYAKDALHHFQQALGRQIKLADKWGTTWCIETIGWTLAELARTRPGSAPALFRSAATLLGGAMRLQQDTGVVITGLLPLHTARERATTAAIDRLGQAAYLEAYHRGTTLTTSELHQLALETPEAPVTPEILSPRRREVAMLVADGLENRQIARKLHLSVKTVENHISAIFTTLGVHNRAQIATWATKHSTRPVDKPAAHTGPPNSRLTRGRGTSGTVRGSC